MFESICWTSTAGATSVSRTPLIIGPTRRCGGRTQRSTLYWVDIDYPGEEVPSGRILRSQRARGARLPLGKLSLGVTGFAGGKALVAQAALATGAFVLISEQDVCRNGNTYHEEV